MAAEYGSGDSYTVSMEGPFGNVDPSVKTATLTLQTASWKNAESPFTQNIVLEGISKFSMIDLKPTQEQIAKLGALGIALTICNNSGVITAYASGGKPDTTMKIPATITEVTGGDVIWGNTVGADASQYANLKNTKELINAGVIECKKYSDGKHMTAEMKLTASGWIGETAPYKQTISIDGILPTDRPHYGVVYSENWEAEMEAFSAVDDLETEAGRLIFTCYEEKPEVDLTIQLEVNR